MPHNIHRCSFLYSELFPTPSLLCENLIYTNPISAHALFTLSSISAHYASFLKHFPVKFLSLHLKPLSAPAPQYSPHPLSTPKLLFDAFPPIELITAVQLQVRRALQRPPLFPYSAQYLPSLYLPRLKMST